MLYGSVFSNKQILHFRKTETNVLPILIVYNSLKGGSL